MPACTILHYENHKKKNISPLHYYKQRFDHISFNQHNPLTEHSYKKLRTCDHINRRSTTFFAKPTHSLSLSTFFVLFFLPKCPVEQFSFLQRQIKQKKNKTRHYMQPNEHRTFSQTYRPPSPTAHLTFAHGSMLRLYVCTYRLHTVGCHSHNNHTEKAIRRTQTP